MQRQRETDILRAVRTFLQGEGWLVFRHHQGLGSLPGFPDLTALKNGSTIYLECKTDKGKLSQAQEQIRQRIEKAGGIYTVMRSVEDAAGVIRQIGGECYSQESLIR